MKQTVKDTPRFVSEYDKLKETLGALGFTCTSTKNDGEERETGCVYEKEEKINKLQFKFEVEIYLTGDVKTKIYNLNSWSGWSIPLDASALSQLEKGIERLEDNKVGDLGDVIKTPPAIGVGEINIEGNKEPDQMYLLLKGYVDKATERK